MKTLLSSSFFLLYSACLLLLPAQATVHYPDTPPGKAAVNTNGDLITLNNNLLQAQYKTTGEKISFVKLSAHGKTIAEQGELFILNTKEGQSIPSSSMVLTKQPELIDLPAEPKSAQLSRRVPGKAMEATFTSPDKSLRVHWRTVLRDGSHYLRNEMTISSSKDIEMAGIIGMQYQVAYDNTTGEGLKASGNTRGSLITSPSAFMALETPMGKNTILSANGDEDSPWSPYAWESSTWKEGSNAPAELKEKFGSQLKVSQGKINIPSPGKCEITFLYKSGHFRLNIAGVQLLDEKGQPVSQDLHTGATGLKSENNLYSLNVPQAGTYQLKFWVETKTERLDSTGEIAFSLPVKPVLPENSIRESQIAQGLWDRHATLKKGQPWELSSVLGLFVPGQERRSFLAYLERERTAPYRPFVHYNSWFELNVHTNNNPDPLKRMVEKQCLDILSTWQEKMYKQRKVNLDSFVWDDGWDDFNSLWGFHKGFPNGFKRVSQEAKKQKAGIGAWLGPVGGYYQSKQMRIASWNRNHPDNQIKNFQLENEEYYNAFYGRCVQMIQDYGMNYFKLDGISTMPTTKGPDTNREEDAEGILRLATDLRKARQDVFLNCTVGTWASPFWFRYADSIWRQGGDHGFAGVGNSREKWITYRDQVIWDSFVKSSPLCPINSLMFHGVTISKNGAPKNMPNDNLDSFKNEMRCAFASGSCLQELYVDHDIMTNFQNGILWDELARCIKWFRKNTDVLADTHWVGGSPSALDIYGWASWNPRKAVFTLRNPSDKSQDITLTLKEVLDLPTNIKTPFIFKNVFDDQRNIDGFTGKSLSPDQKITITLKPFEVIVWESERK